VEDVRLNLSRSVSERNYVRLSSLPSLSVPMRFNSNVPASLFVLPCEQQRCIPPIPTNLETLEKILAAHDKIIRQRVYIVLIQIERPRRRPMALTVIMAVCIPLAFCRPCGPLQLMLPQIPQISHLNMAVLTIQKLMSLTCARIMHCLWPLLLHKVLVLWRANVLLTLLTHNAQRLSESNNESIKGKTNLMTISPYNIWRDIRHRTSCCARTPKP
jgi:hypothetical protein